MKTETDQNQLDQADDDVLMAKEESGQENEQRERNGHIVDKIASLLNKVLASTERDRFATPLRLERDLRYGMEKHPIELEQTAGIRPKRLPPINW